LAVLVVAMAMTVFTSPALSATPDSWETVTPMPKPGTFNTATGGIGVDRRIYYIRGGAGGEAYDLDTGIWTTLPPTLLPQRTGNAVTTGGDGRVYVIGGVAIGVGPRTPPSTPSRPTTHA